ncbi:MAG: 4-vinyl reductase [Candidatus Aenigmatarchaeota archaeon]
MRRRSFISTLIESGQLITDNFDHPILLGEYLLLVPMGVILKLQEILKEVVGKETTKKIFFSLGEFQVEAAARRYMKMFHLEKLDKRKIMDFTIKIIGSLGWGKFLIKKLSFKEKTAIVILKGSALAMKYKQIYQKNSDEPIDYWLSGIIAKHFSVIFETEMEVKEVKCLAMGDPYCEFIAKPKF